MYHGFKFDDGEDSNCEGDDTDDGDQTELYRERPSSEPPECRSQGKSFIFVFHAPCISLLMSLIFIVVFFCRLWQLLLFLAGILRTILRIGARLVLLWSF